MSRLFFEALFPDVIPPTRATSGSAGYDLRACLLGTQQDADELLPVLRRVQCRNERNAPYELVARTDELLRRVFVTLAPGHRMLVPLGFRAQAGFQVVTDIRPRSGLAWKHGITVLNAPGTIDADYPDEWLVMLHNTSEESFEIAHQDRIAQAVFHHVLEPEVFVTRLPTPAAVIQRYPETNQGLGARTGGLGSTGVA